MSKPEFFYLIEKKHVQRFNSRAEVTAAVENAQVEPAQMACIEGTAHSLTATIVFAPIDGASTAPQPKREPVDNTEVNAKVLAYLRSNPDTRRFKDIEAATGLTGAQLTDAKKALVKAGEVNDEGKGAMSAKVHAEQGT